MKTLTKNVILMLAIGLVTSINTNAQWTNVNSGTPERLNVVCIVNKDLIFVGGKNGTLLKSTNGGQTWAPIFTGTDLDIGSIRFVNNSAGFLVGEDGLFMQSNNGGSSWTQHATGVFSELEST
ncbi:MAG: hypothetical protein R2750_02605 [Bacteroidales bacterium]